MIEPTRPAPAKTGSARVLRQQQAFDETTEETAELEREANVLRDMMLEQLKDDDATLKKYIAMI